MKTLKLNVIFITLLLLFSQVVYSQTQYSKIKKTSYPQWSLNPVGGVTIPTGQLSDNFQSGANFGFDLSYKVNKEVGFYGEFGYSFLRNQTQGIPDGKYIEYTAGPRYYFTAKNLKSSIFLEAGVGAYTFKQDSYVLNNVTVPEASDTKFGFNAGIGAILNLGRDLDLLFKTKYNTILTTGGSSSFITPVLGLDIRF